MNMLYAIKDLLPNPFRKIDRYPIKREKVEALKESLSRTGFWDNVVGRRKGNQVEIAYGHHRRVALREFYALDHRVGIILRDLSDEAMLQIMARENMEEWGTSAVVEQETIRATVEAYAEGKIALEPPSLKTHKSDIRYAPGFIQGGGGDDNVYVRDHPYTTASLVKFLGWDETKVYDTLAALQLIEEGILREQQFEGRKTTEARNIVIETRRRKESREREARNKEKEAEGATSERRKEYLREEAERLRKQGKEEATLIGRRLDEEIGSGKRGFLEARKIADEVVPIPKSDRPPPDINAFVLTLAKQIDDLLHRDQYAEKLERIIQFRGNLDKGPKRELINELTRLAKRAESIAKKLLIPSNPSTTSNRKVLSNGG